MEKCVATIVIEPRLLVREALVSLMASHSFQVVGGVASTADIDNSLPAEDSPRLVILGPLPADEAARAARSIRKMWPESKIILLFDHASSVDFQTLLASEIDGCIPLFASPDTLVGTLQQIRYPTTRIAYSPTLALARMFALPVATYQDPEMSWRYASPTGRSRRSRS